MIERRKALNAAADCRTGLSVFGLVIEYLGRLQIIRRRIGYAQGSPAARDRRFDLLELWARVVRAREALEAVELLGSMRPTDALQ